MVMRDDISLLVDGELGADQTDTLIQRIGRDEEARETWATYHLIGDVLRGDSVHHAGIQNRIIEKLAEEPTVLAPKRRTTLPRPVARLGMAVAASVATLSVVAWMAGQDGRQQFAEKTASQNTSIVVPADSPIQPANLSEYLSAHEEFLPSTAGYRRVLNVKTVAPASGAVGQ
jgi:sigma-E factor negative regulatory protein RseA